MSTQTDRLAFGYNNRLDGATCAWGARWIVTQQGGVDFVPDRQDMIGTPEQKQKLLSWLNETVKKQPEERLSRMLRDYMISTRKIQEVCLYEDECGIVVGNANASAGYFYVIARFKTKNELRQDDEARADAEEINHGYHVGHYHPDHIAKYGSPS